MEVRRILKASAKDDPGSRWLPRSTVSGSAVEPPLETSFSGRTSGICARTGTPAKQVTSCSLLTVLSR